MEAGGAGAGCHQRAGRRRMDSLALVGGCGLSQRSKRAKLRIDIMEEVANSRVACQN